MTEDRRLEKSILASVMVVARVVTHVKRAWVAVKQTILSTKSGDAQ